MSNQGTTSQGGTGTGPTPSSSQSSAPPPITAAPPSPPPLAASPSPPPVTAVVQPPQAKPLPPVPATATPPAPKPEKPKATKTPKPKASRSPHNGRVSSEVTNLSSMKAIYNEHDRGVSYERIEENARFNLKKANGMTAYRICRKYEKLTGTKPKPAKRGRPKKK